MAEDNKPAAAPAPKSDGAAGEPRARIVDALMALAGEQPFEEIAARRSALRDLHVPFILPICAGGLALPASRTGKWP